MNKTILKGRFTKDTEVKYAQSNGENLAIANNILAVNRRGKDAGADFITCKAFGKTAEFMEKYCKKGTSFLIEGRIQTGSYEKDGHKVYTTDIIIDQLEFCEKKADGSETPAAGDEEFMTIPDAIAEELPF